MPSSAKLEQLLREADALGASDVFLIPGEPVTMRIDGEIRRTEGEILTSAEIDEWAVATFDEERMAEFQKSFLMPQCLWSLEGAPTYAREGRIVRMGLTRSCGQNTIYVSLRTPVIGDVEQLRVPKAVLNAALRPGGGLIIFSGGMASGKSTTEYSVVDYINANRACHITTAEDAIYARFTPKKAAIRQHEIGGDAPSVLWVAHAALGQSVDVFFANLIKDLDGLNAVLWAAEIGQLVVTGSLADTPQEVIERWIDAFPENQRQLTAKTLARALRAICSQKLLPGATGGSVPAYAVMIPDEEMRKAIAEGRDPKLRESPMPPGCQTMEEAIQQLLEAGEITAETARKTLAEIE